MIYVSEAVTTTMTFYKNNKEFEDLIKKAEHQIIQDAQMGYEQTQFSVDCRFYANFRRVMQMHGFTCERIPAETGGTVRLRVMWELPPVEITGFEGI